MLAIVKKWFGGRANPIGIDLGTDSVKMAQVARVDNDWHLVAAASADVPAHVRQSLPMKAAFLAQTVRELFAQGGFRGRAAVLALPAASMFIQHLRLPKMDDEATKKALPWEARGKLPIDPSHALLRHHIAGTVFQDQEEKNEVIVMAAGKDVVHQYLDAVARAKLDIVGMTVEPQAIVDCFSHVYRRKTDAEVTSCYVDIGCAGTRAIIARGPHILFARAIPVGGDHLTRAVASALNLSLEEAKLLRLRLATAPPSQTPASQPTATGSGPAQADGSVPDRRQGSDPRELAGVLSSDTPPSQPIEAGSSDQTAARVEQACRDPLNRLVQELDLCRRYYEATFPSRAVDRLIFIGGEARHRSLCQYVARELGLPAQVGDPMVRMGRTSRVSPDSGIDCRLPQPNWAVAIGLSTGPNEALRASSQAA